MWKIVIKRTFFFISLFFLWLILKRASLIKEILSPIRITSFSRLLRFFRCAEGIILSKIWMYFLFLISNTNFFLIRCIETTATTTTVRFDSAFKNIRRRRSRLLSLITSFRITFLFWLLKIKQITSFPISLLLSLNCQLLELRPLLLFKKLN